jgi:hypothetical protein
MWPFKKRKKDEPIADVVIVKFDSIYIGIDFHNGHVFHEIVHAGDLRDEACKRLAEKMRDAARKKCSCIRCLIAGLRITTFKQTDIKDMKLKKADQQF